MLDESNEAGLGMLLVRSDGDSAKRIDADYADAFGLVSQRDAHEWEIGPKQTKLLDLKHSFVRKYAVDAHLHSLKGESHRYIAKDGNDSSGNEGEEGEELSGSEGSVNC